MKKISLIIPVYNEEKNVSFLHERLISAWKNLPSYEYEIIFVNDGSSDNSALAIDAIERKDPRVRSVEFSRNFGKEAATSAGLAQASGDAAIMIDADMQHPIELIPKFVSKWEDGADVIIGIRKSHKGESFIKRVGSDLFYTIMSIIAETEIIPHETDFRLIDRQVIDAFNRLSERERITRGLIDWLGFRREYIEFEAAKRLSGDPGYGPWKLVELAVNSFVSHSLFPLKFAGYLGIFIVTCSGILGLFIFIEKYALNDILDLRFSGPAILATINLFLVGIILCCLGLISLYIGTIKSETANRPLYVIRKKR